MADAERIASKQKQISISEFFEKNKHFLGFDTLQRAVITAVKESVDNSLDACEEARILPCLLYTSPSPRDLSTSRMPSSA